MQSNSSKKNNSTQKNYNFNVKISRTNPHSVELITSSLYQLHLALPEWRWEESPACWPHMLANFPDTSRLDDGHQVTKTATSPFCLLQVRRERFSCEMSFLFPLMSLSSQINDRILHVWCYRLHFSHFCQIFLKIFPKDDGWFFFKICTWCYIWINDSCLSREHSLIKSRN